MPTVAVQAFRDRSILSCAKVTGLPVRRLTVRSRMGHRPADAAERDLAPPNASLTVLSRRSNARMNRVVHPPEVSNISGRWPVVLGAQRPSRRAPDCRAQQSNVSQDGSEPVVGGRLQHLRHPTCGRRVRSVRRCSARSAGGRDVGQHDRRCGQRTTASARRHLITSAYSHSASGAPA